MSKTLYLTAGAALLGMLPAAFAQKAYFTEPAVAPNRAEIAFVSGGDIWTAPLAGGEAHLLVAHPANETRPMYSPDGSRLAFVSNRTGNGDIYVLHLGTGTLKRITFDDVPEVLDGWSRDGKYLYFSSTAQDVAGMNDVFRVSSEGGTPMPVTADRYVAEYFSAPSPDGKSLAFTARGNTNGQWWRHGHSHLDESEIWVMTGAKYEKLHGGDFKSLWPMWSADGARVYFMSDEGGAENVWEKPLRGGAARQITQFKEGRVLWPSISYDGRTIVFERDFGIWKLDVASGKSSAVEITRRGAPSGPEAVHLTLNNGFRDLVVSPDGRKAAFVAHGEVFAASSRDGGQAARVTSTVANEQQIAWSPDSKRMAYVSDRGARYRVYAYDFAAGMETPIGDGTAPGFSPDGKMLVLVKDGKELCVYDVGAKQTRVLVANGDFPRPPFGANRFYAWSPDSKWVAFFNEGDRGFRNVWVAPAAGGAPRQVSFLSNTNSGSVLWSPDGTYLLFDTNQRTEDNQIARVDLVLKAPKFREDRFRDLFKESPSGGRGAVGAAAATPPPALPAKPVEIVFDGIRNRLTRLPIGLDARLQQISPDGKTLLFTATAARQQNLYTYSMDELATEPAVARQVTSTPGAKSNAQFSPDGKDLFYLEQGRIAVMPLDTRVSRPVAVTAEMDVDFEQEKSEVFQEAWTYLNDNFFDANFNGVDWKGAREKFAPYAAGARTPDELRRVISLMLGELNASHMGISAGGAGGPDAPRPVAGKLGLRFDGTEYATSGRLKVGEVIGLGPAAVAGGIKAGDILTAIDGVKIGANTNLDELLEHKVGQRVMLTTSAGEVAVRPVGTAAEKDLVYREWVDEMRAYVAKASGGRLGYVHIRDMSANALEQLYLDLDTENQGREGVVVDVRNNNGGFVNVYAIDVLARRSYLQMTDRGRPAAPARVVLGQRSLERPTVLVTNRHSLSDAEDFTEGYRSLKLGKVVGEPTAGWIIYTSNATLIDGSSLRLPGTRVTTADGAAMEMSPRQVDVAADRPVGEMLSGKDGQLDAAVRELLKDVDAKKGGRKGNE